jgi:hypothetical protein
MIGRPRVQSEASGVSGSPEGMRRLSTLSRRTLIAARKAVSISVTVVNCATSTLYLSMT